MCIGFQKNGSHVIQQSEIEQKDIRIIRGQWTTENGLKTEVIRVSIVAGDDIADYDPQEDADLYEYWKAEDRYWQE